MCIHCPKYRASPTEGPECCGSHRSYIIVGVIQTVLKFYKDHFGGKKSMKKTEEADVLESGRRGDPGGREGTYTEGNGGRGRLLAGKRNER